jgi:hypothetical protein
VRVKTYDLSNRIILVRSQSRDTIPLRAGATKEKARPRQFKLTRGSKPIQNLEELNLDARMQFPPDAEGVVTIVAATAGCEARATSDGPAVQGGDMGPSKAPPIMRCWLPAAAHL